MSKKKEVKKPNAVTKSSIDKSEKEIIAELENCHKEMASIKQRYEYLATQSKVLAGALHAVQKLRSDHFDEPPAAAKI
jgi:hypothetical protein